MSSSVPIVRLPVDHGWLSKYRRWDQLDPFRAAGPRQEGQQSIKFEPIRSGRIWHLAPQSFQSSTSTHETPVLFFRQIRVQVFGPERQLDCERETVMQVVESS